MHWVDRTQHNILQQREAVLVLLGHVVLLAGFCSSSFHTLLHSRSYTNTRPPLASRDAAAPSGGEAIVSCE